jgi:hypothetical protein
MVGVRTARSKMGDFYLLLLCGISSSTWWSHGLSMHFSYVSRRLARRSEGTREESGDTCRSATTRFLIRKFFQLLAVDE